MNIKRLVLFVFTLLWGLYSYGQQKTVTGTVSDEHNMPIPGVNIVIKNTSSGTNTDFDGNFSINVSPGEVLEFSFVGFRTEERAVGSDDQIHVVLSEDSQSLDEVIVTAFGRKMTRNESTSSVVSVSSDQILKSSSTSADEALQGTVSGLNFSTTSGSPGAAPQIRIRGINSVTASNSPLFVIDGVPVTSGDISGGDGASVNIFSLINPNDIENISVLKDAAAVAPYGADGSNGVILVTTKSGVKGNARFNFNYGLGIANWTVPGHISVNSEQKLEVLEEAYWNHYGNRIGGDGVQIGNGTLTSKDQVYDYMLNVQKVPQLLMWERQGRPDEDWRAIIRNKNAISHNLNFSVSQGSDKYNFSASLGYNETEGTVLGASLKRLNGRVRQSIKLTEKLNLGINTSISNVDQSGPLENAPWLSNVNLVRMAASPWIPAYLEDGSYNLDDMSAVTSIQNVAYTAREFTRTNNITRGMMNVNLDYQITDKLSFNSVLGLDYTLAYFEKFDGIGHGDGINEHGRKRERSGRIFDYTTQNSLNYNFTLGDKNNFAVSAIQEFSKVKNKFLYGYGENYPNMNIRNLSAATANFQANSEFSDGLKMRYVGLVNYNYDRKYLVDASYSYQGDSRFSNKFDSFYSVGLGWNIHREDFLQSVDAINELRLKFGYGITGNAGIDRNQYQILLGYDRYRSNPAANIVGYGSATKWEKSNRMDVSLDYGFFNNRLRGTLGVYMNRTKDMLFEVPLPPSATFMDGGGNMVVVRNFGEMENKGLEFEVSGDLISTDDFKWNVGLNGSTMKNRVTKLPQDAEMDKEQYIVREGHQVFEWYMPEWAGVDPDNGMPLWYVDRGQSDATTSDLNQASRNYVGKGRLPTYNGSLSTRFEYKNLFLEGSLYFSGGNKVYELRTRYPQSTDGNKLASFSVGMDAYENAWRNPGDVATYPRFDVNDSNISSAGDDVSTRWLYNADFMRLRNVGVGYTFEKGGILPLQDLGIDNLTLSIRGQNLWTWVRDKNLKYDPEVVGDDGQTTLRTPPSKTVTFNININF